MSKFKQTLAFIALSVASVASGAADVDQTLLLINVDAIELNNRLEPNGYADVMTEFAVKNIDTGKTYTERSSSYGYPSVLRLPAGAYCFYSITIAFNGVLTYCREPTFDVKDGKINNAGKWRFGISTEGDAYKLMYAFKDPDKNSCSSQSALSELIRAYFCCEVGSNNSFKPKPLRGSA